MIDLVVKFRACFLEEDICAEISSIRLGVRFVQLFNIRTTRRKQKSSFLGHAPIESGREMW
jgi:hypothetical protein